MASDTTVLVQNNLCLSTKASAAVDNSALFERCLCVAHACQYNSLVAWYRIREQCPVAVLSPLIAQRKQLPEWYARLVRVTAQELMSVLFERA
jgi:hypothetical protein